MKQNVFFLVFPAVLPKSFACENNCDNGVSSAASPKKKNFPTVGSSTPPEARGLVLCRVSLRGGWRPASRADKQPQAR